MRGSGIRKERKEKNSHRLTQTHADGKGKKMEDERIGSLEGGQRKGQEGGKMGGNGMGNSEGEEGKE